MPNAVYLKTYYGNPVVPAGREPRRDGPAALNHSILPLVNSIGVFPGLLKNPFDSNVETQILNLIPDKRIDDRKAELVPKIMKKLEDLHLANSVYETKDLPALWRLLRGPSDPVPAVIQKMTSGFRALKAASRGKFGPATRILRDSLKRGSFANAAIRKELDFLREVALANQFGLLPTVKDVYDIHQSLKRRRPRPRTFVTTVTDQGEYSNRNYIERYSIYGGPNHTLYTEARIKRVFGCKVVYTPPDGLLELLDPGIVARIDELIGVNPTAIIWEAVPFSFVVDWFLSIDNVLNAIWLSGNDRYKATFWASSKLTYDARLFYESVQWMDSGWGYYPSYTRPNNPAQIYSGHVHTRNYVHYNRTLVAAPTATSQLKSRLTLKKGFLGLLVAIGLV
jgi:hypothetical protein